MSFCATTRRLEAETVDDLEAVNGHGARSLSYAENKESRPRFMSDGPFISVPAMPVSRDESFVHRKLKR